MTALSTGDSWYVIAVLAFTYAVVCLAATVVYLVLTWRQDREEWSRPERRRWVSVEESNAEERQRSSVYGLVVTAVANLTVIVLSVAS